MMFIMGGLVDIVSLLLLCVFGVHCIKLPPYLKPCSLSDPNLNECCVKHGKEALPFLVKGDRKYNIPNLSPLFLPSLYMNVGKDLHITMTDIYAYGLERTDIEQIRFDAKNMKASLKTRIDNLQLIGKYEMVGKILFLPVQGKGDFNITAIDGEYQYEFQYTLRRKGNQSYAVVKDNDKLNFELKDAIVKLDNLFNGDDTLGKHVNTFLNENWKEVLKEIGGALSETVRSVSRTIFTGYTSKVPFNELFLD
ncbi:protein takeout-like [Anoplophora glabripennis]|uniref:protein takeout-like n=1 Tax=Anoplophora glabripennis TaxID=217634 RepID=UPI00087388ED|nr:protein takeout-like [Anoplophora glabripennis]